MRGWVAGLDAAIQAEPVLAQLPGRFWFSVDDGRGDVSGLGADVGVHAATHRSHRRMTPRRIVDDIRRAYDTVVAAGAVPLFHRPPHGATSPEGLLTARRLGMRTVLWTAWGRDWRAEATPESVRDDVAAGRLTPQQAVDRLVNEIAGTQALDASQRAELREMMADLIANDPNLAALVGRI